MTTPREVILQEHINVLETQLDNLLCKQSIADFTIAEHKFLLTKLENSVKLLGFSVIFIGVGLILHYSLGSF